MAEGMNKIEHLIVLMMENRSFDHYLGALSLPPENRGDVEGLSDPLPTIPDKDGNPVSAWKMDGNYCGYGDSPHGWDAQRNNYNNGNNDGFVREYQTVFPDGQDDKSPAKIPMGYYTRASLPTLYALADRFTICDHWFSSLLSSTWPNRKYLHSGRRDADNDTQTLPPFPGFDTTPFYNVLEDTKNPDTGNNYTWKCYFSDLPFLGFWYKFAAFHALHNFTSIDNFINDCREDRLPTISIIDPPFSLADDHPAHNVQLGQKFIGLIVDALTHSESWAKSALVILYDENGGFYDHVAPPPSFEREAGLDPLDDPLGFRVPAIVVSPYAKQQQVCKTVFDHTSIMKSVSVRWSVEFDSAVYGTRWQNAPDIWTDCFDFTQPPLPMGTYTRSQADLDAEVPDPLRTLDWATGINTLAASPAEGVEDLLERIFILPGLKMLDHRASVFDNLHQMEQNVVTLKRMF